MYAIVSLESIRQLPKLGCWFVEPYPLEPNGFQLPRPGLWYFFPGAGVFPRFYQDLNMSGKYATIFYDAKRSTFRILNGNETFYDENNVMREWSTEIEAGDWLAANHPSLIVRFETRPVVLYDTLPLFDLPKPEKKENGKKPVK